MLALTLWCVGAAGAPHAHGAGVVPGSDARLLLPRVTAASERIALDVSIRVTEDLLALAPVASRLRGLDGQPLPDGAVEFELEGVAGGGMVAAGSLLVGHLRVQASAVRAAGEYPVDLTLMLVPASAAAAAGGPPAPVTETLLFSLSRRLATLSAAAPGRVEIQAWPWHSGIAGQTSIHLTETSGRMALPALEVAPRGAALELTAGSREAPLVLSGPVSVTDRGADAADLGIRFSGNVGAGHYQLPIEVLSGGAAAPLAVDLNVWVRHPPVLLGAGTALGVLLGLVFSALARRKEGGEERARILARGRMDIERYLASAVDQPLTERLTGIVERLRRKESHAAFGVGDPRRLVIEAESEALMALRDLESRRLAAERSLVHLESALQPSTSDAPEIASSLAGFLRRVEELRHRLDRGEVSSVEVEVAALRVDASREVGEAGRRWLLAARDLLEGLRQRIPQSGRVHLFESVRLSLEAFAGRIAEGSVDRIRDTIVAGRAAATTLGEQSFALAYKPAWRDLADLSALLTEFVPETELRPVETARHAAETALEPGALVTTLRPLAALSAYQDAIEQALAALAGDAWTGDAWKAVREAISLREYARVLEAVESVLRHRGRERASSPRRARVLEIVRLAPRPSPPAFRVGWDSPPVVGFPVIARIVWLGLEPRRFAVSWGAEGLDVKVETPSVASTSLVFAEPGWAALRAVVEVEGESAPLVAQTRLRVLPESAVAVGRRSGAAGLNIWGVALAALTAAVAIALGQVLWAGGFTGTPGDYALAAGFGLLFELTVDRVAPLVGSRRAAASGSGAGETPSR